MYDSHNGKAGADILTCTSFRIVKDVAGQITYRGALSSKGLCRTFGPFGRRFGFLRCHRRLPFCTSFSTVTDVAGLMTYARI